jgi:hypothetical protein
MNQQNNLLLKIPKKPKGKNETYSQFSINLDSKREAFP